MGYIVYKGVHHGYNAGMAIHAMMDMYGHTCNYDVGMAIPAISDMYDHTCDYVMGMAIPGTSDMYDHVFLYSHLCHTSLLYNTRCSFLYELLWETDKWYTFQFS